MTFEERIQSSFRNRLLYALILLFDTPHKLPSVGEQVNFICGRLDTYLSKGIVIAADPKRRKYPFDEYGYLTFERRNDKGNKVALGEIPPHRIVKDTAKVRKLLALVNATPQLPHKQEGEK